VLSRNAIYVWSTFAEGSNPFIHLIPQALAMCGVQQRTLIQLGDEQCMATRTAESREWDFVVRSYFCPTTTTTAVSAGTASTERAAPHTLIAPLGYATGFYGNGDGDSTDNHGHTVAKAVRVKPIRDRKFSWCFFGTVRGRPGRERMLMALDAVPGGDTLTTAGFADEKTMIPPHELRQRMNDCKVRE
jgi:hypothetical protein